MSEIKFRMAAKSDVGLERTNNEDNFQAAANLEETPMRWVSNQVYSLGPKGALLVVADGMGGMNAGEVASEIAIETVRELFNPERITDEVVKTRYTIEKFMKGVIVEADKRIKEYAKQHAESRGMGTTIVIAWLFDKSLYVSWCGDSRAYIYNPSNGLFQITKDHSYVQQLVDSGKISKEDAFDFPDSNIITRSLSDASPRPNPDCMVMPQPLCNGDIIMLCSDGLNGMIRDNEIETVMTQHQDNMIECVDALINAALQAAGADNCTVAVCQILEGGAVSGSDRMPKASKMQNTVQTTAPSSDPIRKGLLISLIAALLLILGGAAWWQLHPRPIEVNSPPAQEEKTEEEVPKDDGPSAEDGDALKEEQSAGESGTQDEEKENAKTDEKKNDNPIKELGDVLTKKIYQDIGKDNFLSQEYIVKSGDTWSKIAKELKIDVAVLIDFNGADKDATLNVDQKIQIPVKP